MHALSTLAAAGDFGTKGIRDFILFSILPLIMLVVVAKVYIVGKDGNYKKTIAIVGCFMLATLMLGFVLVPDLVIDMATSLANKFQQGT